MPEKQYQIDFLKKALRAALEANHIWPEYACCEAALESSWGRSGLATGANNLFGQKQGKKVPLPYPTVDWRTKEIKNGQEVWEAATWLHFPDWTTSFRERMALLRRLDIYRAALTAQSGEQFVREVSGHWIVRPEGGRDYIGRWATDPLRAEKILTVHSKHGELLTSLIPSSLSHP